MLTRSDSANDAGRISRGPVASPCPSERGMGAQNRGVKSENVRASNMSTVLRNILTLPGEVTRAGLSQRTGMTRATISRLVDDLVGAGLVRELEPGDGGGRGRPANRLTPAEGSAVALGVEVDVASLDVMLVDIAGRELGRRRIERDFADSAPEETMALAAREAHALLEGTLPDGALFLGTGVGLPGLVSPTRLALAPNLGWRDIPHDQLLAPLADLNPVVVANEADLAAYAVAYTRPGVAGGPSTFVYVSGEVGVGAGVIVDHRPMSGARAWSGEIGHMCADPNGPLCRCGARGCLEAYLGVRALAEHVGAPAGSGPRGILRCAGLVDEAGAKTSGSLGVSAEQERARAVLAEAGAALGRVLSGVINAMDIPHVVLGGAVAELSGALLDPAREEIETRTLQAPWSSPIVEVLPDSASLTVRGAAFRVLDALVDDPAAFLG
ncbi:ROK family transcriptional regulator [Schaalia odontolytica]|uniref:ROK family protein n=2 Tax=Schaalia odontolytica TaxID=1660 RepID=A0A857A522_9ACTO|nr:ROK family transcriptional regulator [Schaalia odontolytica]QGS10201.1 ROK family protein [Schaalia odontolytica]